MTSNPRDALSIADFGQVLEPQVADSAMSHHENRKVLHSFLRSLRSSASIFSLRTTLSEHLRTHSTLMRHEQRQKEAYRTSNTRQHRLRLHPAETPRHVATGRKVAHIITSTVFLSATHQNFGLRGSDEEKSMILRSGKWPGRQGSRRTTHASTRIVEHRSRSSASIERFKIVRLSCSGVRAGKRQHGGWLRTYQSSSAGAGQTLLQCPQPWKLGALKWETAVSKPEKYSGSISPCFAR